MARQKKTREVFRLTIDYTRNLKDVIVAGYYDYVNKSITEASFPLGVEEQSKKELIMKLFCFNRYVKSEEAIREMDGKGYRPATLRELLAFGEKYPELQRQFPIVALGSVWTGPDRVSCVPMLRGDSAHRDLFLHCLGGIWDSDYRFLAVRK